MKTPEVFPGLFGLSLMESFFSDSSEFSDSGNARLEFIYYRFRCMGGAFLHLIISLDINYSSKKKK